MRYVINYIISPYKNLLLPYANQANNTVPDSRKTERRNFVAKRSRLPQLTTALDSVIAPFYTAMLCKRSNAI
ncbi:MAG: hypothetical protein KUG82_18880 [Pseudomonadales bacterium]|nr:hypothetical protein [Pseudomonadales bacterium]